MFYTKYIMLFFLLLSVNSFPDINFSYPLTTPPGTISPNLSVIECTSYYPNVTINSSGKYVYAIWTRFDGFYFITQTARSKDYGINWINPTTTTGSGGPPNLSDNSIPSRDSKITTSSSGKYVYAVWDVTTSAQSVRSITYGDNWIVSATTPAGVSTKNISVDGSVGQTSIVTDSSGKNVYSIWIMLDGSSHWIVQTVKSNDYGENWQNPSSTTGSSPPNLSSNGNYAWLPQITTNSTGKYVYAIWQRNNGLNFIIQMVRSVDNGDNWINPTTTTGNDGPPNLSDNGEDAGDSQIVTDYTGKYVYAIWSRANVIQMVRSDNYGKDWQNPTITPGSNPPNLSVNAVIAITPQIVTDLSGKYVYAVWNGSGVIQAAISSDYGVTWTDPFVTTGSSIPDLSGGGAEVPQVTTDNTGQYVYVTWVRSGRIQVVASLNSGRTWVNLTSSPQIIPNISLIDCEVPQIVTNESGKYVNVIWRYDDNASGNIITQISNGLIDIFNVSCQQYNTKLILQKDLVNSLSWNSMLGAQKYKVYINSLSNLLYEGNDLLYYQHWSKTGGVYYITWIDMYGIESVPFPVRFK